MMAVHCYDRKKRDEGEHAVSGMVDHVHDGAGPDEEEGERGVRNPRQLDQVAKAEVDRHTEDEESREDEPDRTIAFADYANEAADEQLRARGLVVVDVRVLGGRRSAGEIGEQGGGQEPVLGKVATGLVVLELLVDGRERTPKRENGKLDDEEGRV